MMHLKEKEYAKGEREGALKNQKENLLNTLTDRFGAVPQAVLDAVVRTTDIDILRELTRAARRIASPAAFQACLAASDAQGRRRRPTVWTTWAVWASRAVWASFQASSAYPGTHMVQAHVGCALAVRKRPNRALVRGRVEGLAQGRAEGHAKGLREGLKRGELQNQKLYLLCLVKERFKTVPQAVLEFAVKTTDMQALRDLTGEARRAASLTDFPAFLAARQAQSATALSASSAPACRDDRLQDGRWDSRPAAELQRPDRVRISGLRMKDKALRAEGHAQGRADGLIAGQSQGMAEGMAEQRRQAEQHGLIQCLRKMALNKFGVSLPDEWLAVAAADMKRLHDLARGAARAATLSDFQDLLQAERMWPIEPTWASGPAGVSGRRRRRTDRAGRPARRAPGLAVPLPSRRSPVASAAKNRIRARVMSAGAFAGLDYSVLVRGRVEGRVRGLAEGRVKGLAEGLRRSAVHNQRGHALDTLTERFGPMPQAVLEYLARTTDLDSLHALTSFALRVESPEAFLEKTAEDPGEVVRSSFAVTPDASSGPPPEEESAFMRGFAEFLARDKRDRRIPGNWEALLASGKIEKGLRTYWAGQAVREMRLRAEGRAAGLAEGMIEGLNQGRALAFDPTFIEDYAQGYVEGFLGDHAEGRAEEQHTIATRLLALGRLTLEEIAACAGLPLDEVRALAAQQQS